MIKKTTFLIFILLIVAIVSGCSCDSCGGCCCGCCGEEDSDGDGACGSEDNECDANGCDTGCEEGYICSDHICNSAAEQEDCSTSEDDDCVDGALGGYNTQGVRKACDADNDGVIDCTFKGATAGACDCDDNNKDIPSADGKELCDGLDNDCDGEVDEDVNDDAPLCSKQIGEICKGSKKTCSIAGKWEDCGIDGYKPGYEPIEVSCCDGKDNDCDGLTDALDVADCANRPCT